jgi:CO dehydrogenase maturation factor
MKKIVIAGKGGVGKTFFSSILITEIAKRNSIILAIDADPNSNLNILLGINLQETIADVMEEMRETKNIPSGIDKQSYLKRRGEDIIVEEEKFDFIAMGKPEGPGCYCAVNNMLREYLENLTKSYQYVIIDSEAGLEHLSRRTAGNFDFLFLVCEPSLVSITSALRAKQICENLEIKYHELVLILNKVRDKVPERVINEVKQNNLRNYYILPWVEEVEEIFERGSSIRELKNVEIINKISRIIDEVILK